MADRAPPVIAEAIALCVTLVVHDGDGFRCNGVKVRLAAIDAPEREGSPACRGWKRRYHDCDFTAGERSRRALVALTTGRTIRCRRVGEGGYGRPGVRCAANGVDLGCAMIAGGFAVERYGDARCLRRS